MSQPSVYSDAERVALRRAVLDELALVQGRVALAGTLKGSEAKEQVRLAHSSQREAWLEESAAFLLAKEDHLIEQFANGREVSPASVDPLIIPVRTPAEADLFKYATLQWSVPVSAGYGRRSRFLVRDRSNGKLIGVFALGDPVIAQSARDSAVGWDVEQRNERLYNVYDAYVLGAVEPYRQILGGKLVALLMLANETRDFLARKYAGKTTAIRGQTKDPTPILITTSSALGRSSVYNRVTYRGHLMLHSVGFTRGFGHFQFSDELFARLLDFVRAESEQSAKGHSSKYGSGPNWRFRVLRTALDALGIPSESLQHNVRREVFLAPLAENWDRFLRGEDNTPHLFDLPASSLGAYWRERWAVPRGERRPDYRYYERDEARLVPQLHNAPRQLTLGATEPPGRVTIGPWRLAVGTGKGIRLDGADAYLTDLRGPAIEMTLGDTTLRSGTREVEAWGSPASVPDADAITSAPALRLVKSPKFRGMSVMDVQVWSEQRSGRARLHQVSVSALEALVGFDVTTWLDSRNVSIGTRGDLLGDTRVPKRLCVVVPTTDRVTPAVLWFLLRAWPQLQMTEPGYSLAVPKMSSPAPRLQDLKNVIDRGPSEG